MLDAAMMHHATSRNPQAGDPGFLWKLTSPTQFADSLKAELPQDRFKALEAVTRSAGAYVEVSDEHVLEAMRLMARCGYLVEPAAAVACAGVIRAREQDLLGVRSQAVIVSTGNGLKDISSLRCMIAMPHASE